MNNQLDGSDIKIIPVEHIRHGSGDIIVDADSYPIVSRHKWCIDAYGYPNTSLPKSATSSGKLYLHKLIFPTANGFVTDHINGNKLDNRLCNLRQATMRQNIWNRGVQKNNTSGFRGVSFYRKSQLYCAKIKISGKLHWIGLFKTALEAAVAYETRARKEFGDFYRPMPNVVLPPERAPVIGEGK